MKITGLGSRIAAFSRPLPSAGVEGQATSSPGTCRKSASKLWEWVGPSWWPPPPGIRITIGTRAAPGADVVFLGDGGAAPPPLAELVQQPFGHLEGPLEDGDVLAHHEDRL